MCRLNITTLFTYRAYTVYIILQNVLKVLQVITILVRIKSLKTKYFVGLYSPPPQKKNYLECPQEISCDVSFRSRTNVTTKAETNLYYNYTYYYIFRNIG